MSPDEVSDPLDVDLDAICAHDYLSVAKASYGIENDVQTLCEYCCHACLVHYAGTVAFYGHLCYLIAAFHEKAASACEGDSVSLPCGVRSPCQSHDGWLHGAVLAVVSVPVDSAVRFSSVWTGRISAHEGGHGRRCRFRRRLRW